MHIWGACGVGKSQIVAQVADDLGYAFLDVRAVQLDPADLRGLPRITGNQTEWVAPKFLPINGKGILFLDELTSAPQMTQAGCYQLVLDRKLGEYTLPDGWVFGMRFYALRWSAQGRRNRRGLALQHQDLARTLEPQIRV